MLKISHIKTAQNAQMLSMKFDSLEHWTKMLRTLVETNREKENPSVAHDLINNAMVDLRNIQKLISPPQEGTTPERPWTDRQLGESDLTP